MSLKINLRHLEETGIHLIGEIPVAELDLGVNDELIHTEKPLRYDLSVELLHDAILATGSLSLPLDCECGRCLKKFKSELKLDGWAAHLPLFPALGTGRYPAGCNRPRHIHAAGTGAACALAQSKPGWP